MPRGESLGARIDALVARIDARIDALASRIDAQGESLADGHADFLDGGTSPTGEAADMDLAILTGHCPPGLLGSAGTLVDPTSVVLLGHRPDHLSPDVASENARIDPAIRAVTAPEIRERGAGAVGQEVAASNLGRRPGCI